MGKLFYNTRMSIIKDILKWEKESNIIPMHRYTIDFLEKQSDEYLVRLQRMMDDLKRRKV